MKRRAIEALRRLLEAAGVEFIDENGGGPALRLKKSIKGKGRKWGAHSHLAKRTQIPQ